MQPEFEHILNRIENEIKCRLPEAEKYPAEVVDAMNYSMSSGGKRIRPLLMYLSYHSFIELQNSITKDNNNVNYSNNKEINDKSIEESKVEKCLLAFMTALEMIHTHSLIHDDLPALDNDSFRRGRPTVHVQYSESTAILAGDALLNYAYEIVAKCIYDFSREIYGADDSNILRRLCRAQYILTSKTGIDGMLGGQSLDVELSGKSVSNEDRDYIYINKTCALIEAPLMIGAVVAGADDAEIEKMQQVGRAVGMAFQIQDDILDVVGDAEKLGKEVSQDARNEKNTFVAEFGIDYSRKYVREQSEKAVEIINSLDDKGCVGASKDLLISLIEQLIDRDH